MECLTYGALATIGTAGNVGEEIQWRYARNPERRLLVTLAAYLMGLPDDFIDGGDFKFRDLWEHRPDKAVYIGALAKIDRCGEPAKKILRAYRPTVQSTATALIMNNHLDKAQLDHLLEDVAEHDQA